MSASLATLARHPLSRDAVRGISVRLERIPGVLKLRYELDADLAALRVPPAGPACRGERLWQHTCFEIFLAARMPAYQEFNFSPSGEWATYSFRDYRQPAAGRTGTPTVSVRSSGDRLALDAAIPLETEARLLVALSAVVESAKGSLSYWALRHPPGKPDFHHADAFALELA